MNNNEKLLWLLQQFSTRNATGRSVQAAQREFYDSLVNELDQHAMSIVNYNRDLAQAALQEAWIKIFLSADRYDPRLASVKTWAKVITSQCANDELRRFYKHEGKIERSNSPTDQGEDGVDPLDGFACPLPGVDDQMYAQQVQRAIAECIESLPAGRGPNYRLAMKLTLDQDLSYAEMKDILAGQSARHADLNAEQVRGWVRQAVVRMKGCINLKLGLAGKGGAK
ncbi:RNA polymerase sigma factor [Herbaspirillum autotrophicum]|uniref:RNA polymerase sigma factor n=1 Tax=Herbaspirillum autotrophicum TaxID=180195 RepID=UPI00067C9F93|nr:sigma-70 family RNA polymerase sigma factor [Herbaspirillum autotrophicum]